MLVLSRKMNEEVVIGENIRVQVLEVRGGRVKLGFTAPPEVRICREELQAAFDDDEYPRGIFVGASAETDWSPTI